MLSQSKSAGHQQATKLFQQHWWHLTSEIMISISAFEKATDY
jgi:hypothetical protein